MGLATDVVVRASVGSPSRDWREAIRAACDPLVKAGAVEARYERRCIEIVEEQGPYIVLSPGIALAHARPEDGVRRLALSVAVLEQPVNFGHPQNDPVDVVLAFGSPDKNAHIGMISVLARHLMHGMAARLRATGSDADAQAILREVIDDVT